MDSILGIGLQSMLVFQSALETTSQNMANANTPNYSRRVINFNSTFQGSVTIESVQRVVDEAANQNVLNTASALSGNQTNFQHLQYLESLLDPNNSAGTTDAQSTGTLARLNSALKALSTLDSQASSMLDRTNYLNQLSLLVSQFSDINTQFSQEQNNVQQTLTSNMTDVNNILQDLASINTQLPTATLESKSNLLDQQYGLLNKLGQYLNFSTRTTSTGATDVYLPDGTAVVLSSTVYPMSTATDPADPTKTIINVTDDTASLRVDNVITSGSLSGLLAYRDQGVIEAGRGMGRLALAIGQLMNAQNKLGLDYNGNLGGNIFNDINSSTLVAGRAVANAINTGTEGPNPLSVTVDNANKLTTSDYTLVFTSPTQYILTRQSDGSQVATGTLSGSYPQSVSVPNEGYTISLANGGYATGDQFLISPTRGALNAFSLAISDPKLLALASPVAGTASATNTGSGTISVAGAVDTTNSAFSLLNLSPPTYQLNPPIKIVFTSTTAYSIVNANTSAVIQSGIPYNPQTSNAVFPTPAPTSYDPGYRVSLSGTISAGDTFDLSYNTNVNDNTNGLAMENLYKNNTMQGGTLTFATAYTLLAGNVSTQTATAQSLYNSSKTLNDAASYRQAQISGVSMQEESSNLQLYQQSYQASAEVLQVAKTVFDAIMSMSGGA